MCALRRLAFGPQVVAIALIGLSAASCSNDSGRFSGLFASDNPSRNEPTGSAPPGASGHVDSGPMPHLAGGEGTSGGGRGMGSYQPGNGEITGTLRPAATKWTWEGGKPIVVAPGENLPRSVRWRSPTSTWRPPADAYSSLGSPARL